MALRKPEMLMVEYRPGSLQAPVLLSHHMATGNSPSLSLSVLLLYPLSTPHHSQVALAGAHSIAHHRILLPQTWCCQEDHQVPFCWYRLKSLCCYPLAHHTELPETPRELKPKETGSTYSQEIPLVPRKRCLPMSSGQGRRTPWSGHVYFGQPITLPMSSKNTRFFL